MLESAWLFIGVVAVLATGVSLSTQTTINRAIPAGNGVAIMSGIAGTLLWLYWAYGAFNVELLAQDGSIVSFTMSPVVILGVVLALPNAYIALTGPAEIIERSVSDPGTQDV